MSTLKIQIDTIDHKNQAYETCGDWRVEGDTVHIFVSEMSDHRYEALVAIHELVEVLIETVKRTGELSLPPPSLIEATDAFDKAFEAGRPPDDDESEPGCVPACPVYQGHMVATATEHLAAMVLGIDYNHYSSEIEGLSQDA